MLTESNQPTAEMTAFYERRTAEHIERVSRCLALMAEGSDVAAELLERARVHDASKFEAAERVPYIWLTEYHRCRHAGQRFAYPPGVADEVKRAIRHHVTSNRHHPEFHADPNDMTDVDLIEMVCDWTAMAQEFGQDGGSARGWADKTVGTRVAFNADTTRRIYEIIAELDRRLASASACGPTSRQTATIRSERAGDAAAIYAVNAASFPTDLEARLVDALRAAGRLTASLVADVDGGVVGHVAFSPVTTAAGAVGVGLAPVAVVPTYRCRGHAAELIRAGLDACRAAGFGWAVVLGEPTYYARFGFLPASEFGLSDEYGGGAAFQALELMPDKLPAGAGLVRYAPEFAAFG